jgi:quercetin dioxygenase-like cupin family protein
VAYIRTPPGKGSASGVHQHDFEQYYYILQGTLTLEIGGETIDAPAGSLLLFRWDSRTGTSTAPTATPASS